LQLRLSNVRPTGLSRPNFFETEREPILKADCRREIYLRPTG
jgi:hypothetical protein